MSKGFKGSKGEKGEPGKNAVIPSEIYTSLGEIGARLNSNDEFHRNLSIHLDKQHDETIKAIDEVCGQLRPIQTDFAAAKNQITNNTLRLQALDDSKDGVIPKLQRDVAVIQTKASIFGGLVGGLVVGLNYVIKFILGRG